MAALFDFDDVESLETAFDRIRWKDFFPFGENLLNGNTAHCDPLRDLAEEFETSGEAFENALFLATGYRRLLVVLLEPSNEEYDSLIQEDAEIDTLDEMNDLLKDASSQKLNIENTCIFDIKPLRFRWQREEESDWEDETFTRELDERAYRTFESMLHALRPSVILVCQCGSSRANNKTAKILCSTMKKTATSTTFNINGHNTEIVYGFHPSMYMIDDYFETHVEHCGIPATGKLRCRDALQELLRLAFHIAINKLAGRKVEVPGLGKLQEAAFGRQPLPFEQANYALEGPPSQMSQALKAMRRTK